MRRFLLTAIAGLSLLAGEARADSTVPALPAATSLGLGVSYLAGPGSADLKYGFSPLTMCLSSGNLTLCSGGVTSAMLASGAAASNLGPAGGDLSGTYPNPSVVKIQGRAVASTAPTSGQVLAWDSGGSQWVPTSAGGGGSGSVTSVALTMPAVFSVTGSPVTTSGTLAVAANGTSGGLPYFDSNTTLASSALLTQFALVTGGGAGGAPAVVASLGTTTTLLHGNAAGLPTFSAVSLTADVTGTLPVGNGGTGAVTFASGKPLFGNGASAISAGTTSGNTTEVATVTGAVVNGNCAQWDGDGNLVDAGGACGGGGGSGTVSSATAGQMAYYASTGTTVAGNANATISSGALTLGQAGSVIGKLLVSGNTSGTITIAPQAAAGTYEFDLPISAGTTGQPLLSGGGAGSPMTFGTLGVAGGGTGLATLTAHAVYVGNGTSAPTALAVGANGQILKGNAGADPSWTATPSLGVAGSTLGSLAMSGNTSGTITIAPQAAAGTWTMKLPTSAGTAGQVLTTDGSGNTSWATSAVSLPLALISGGTHADLSATGGAHQVLRQSSVGADVTVSQLASTDISGLGTAATANTGTGGATIPLLNGNNTFSGTMALTGAFTLSNAFFMPPTNFTSGSTFNFGSADTVACIKKAAGSATTANLPASPSAGRMVAVKDCKGDAATNNITVKTTDGATIDTGSGATGFVLNAAFQYRAFHYNAVNNDWMVE